MGQYTPTQHAELLAEHALAYRQTDFIADLVLPPQGTDKTLVKYYTFAREDANRLTDSEMSSDGMPNQRKFVKTSTEVSLAPYGLFDRIPIADIDSQSDGGDQEMDTVEDLTDDLLLGREKRVSDLLMTSASYASSNKVTLGTAWTAGASTPIADIQTGQRACAKRPNILVLDEVSWHALQRHADIKALLADSATGLPAEQAVANFFDLEQVLVGRVKYNSANAGQAASYSYIWPQGMVLLAHQPSAPRRKQLTLARTYRKSMRSSGTSQGGANAEGGGGFLVTRKIEEERGSEGTVFVKVSLQETSVLVAADAGYLISGAA